MPRPSSRSRAAAPPSANGYKAIRHAIDSQEYAAVYYLHGDDDYLKDASLQSLLDAVLDPATRDFNCDVRSGASLDAETLGSLLNTPPMLATRRVVVIREVNALKKAARAELDRYLDAPSPDTLTILLAPVGQSVDAKLAQRTMACVFEPLIPERVRKWIVHHATTALGVSVTTEAAILLEQAVGNDLQQLSAELDKCASYALGAIGREAPGAAVDGAVALVTDDVVSAVVGVRRGETTVDLLDALAMRDVSRGLALLPHVLAQPKVTAVQIVMLLGTQMLALTWGRAQRDGGWSPSQLSRGYIDYIKGTSGFVGRPWGEAAAAWSKAVSGWTAAELRTVMRLLLDADLTLKNTRVSNDEQVLHSLILGMARQRSSRAA